MTAEESLVRTAVASWKINVDRATKFFAGLSDAQLQHEIAPGKNRLIYLWGHLIAVHDAMLPLLGIGPRRYADLDAAFLEGADRALDVTLTRDELQAGGRRPTAPCRTRSTASPRPTGRPSTPWSRRRTSRSIRSGTACRCS